MYLCPNLKTKYSVNISPARVIHPVYKLSLCFHYRWSKITKLEKEKEKKRKQALSTTNELLKALLLAQFLTQKQRTAKSPLPPKQILILKPWVERAAHLDSLSFIKLGLTNSDGAVAKAVALSSLNHSGQLLRYNWGLKNDGW